jgi:integrase
MDPEEKEDKGLVAKPKHRYATYAAEPGHKNYYRNATSQKIIFKKNINGRVIKISTGTTKIKEARKIAEEALIDMLSSNPQKSKRERQGISNPLLSEIWEDLMNERRPSKDESTMKGYGVSWKYGIEPFWGNKTVLDVNHMNVTKFENWYLKTHPTRTFFNTGKHLRMLFRHMHKSDLITKNPTLRELDEIIIKNTQKEDVGRVYTDEEYIALLANAVTPRTRLCIQIYRRFGLRKNELLKSRRSKWDFEKNVATIWSFKNKKWREIPIPLDLAKDIQNFLKTEPQSEWLFCAATNPAKYTSSQVFDKAWTKTKVAAKIKDATVENAARVHDLRHTFATETAVNGWPVMTACKILDMSSKEYEDTYVHISHDNIRLSMAQLPSGGGK